MPKCKNCNCPILISKNKSNFGKFCSGSCSLKYNQNLLEKNGYIDKENVVGDNIDIKYKIPLK